MLLTVQELRQRVSSELPSLVADLADLTGRGGENERYAWQRSLPRLADVLTTAALDQVHIHFSRRAHHVALEYQLPGASSWCDVVLLGRHSGRPSAIVIELKDWETSTDRPGAAEGLVLRHGVQELHPSDQVRGYVEYCRRFHSAVLQQNAAVNGFVLLTTGMLKHPYTVAPNESLTSCFPIFSMANEDVTKALPKYLAKTLTEQDHQFATNFATGTFQQDRGFMQQIGRTILDGDAKHYELLDNQRRAMHLCLAKARETIADIRARKTVIVVEGPPGCGKSAVAIRLWASLVTDQRVPDGNIVLVTTSQSQSSNLTHLIDQVTGVRVGRGVARKATSFSPIDIPQLSRIRTAACDRALYRDAKSWRSNLAALSEAGVKNRPGAEDNSCLISLVDEAHALINPEREHGVGQFGFVTGLGPQAYHIIRVSRLSVLFLDPDQSFRARENTTIDDIESWAADLGASVERVSLHGVQFRCAGSVEYVAWTESLLNGGSDELNRIYASAWYDGAKSSTGDATSREFGNVVAFVRPTAKRVAGEPASAVADATNAIAVRRSPPDRTNLDFRVFGDPFEMEQELRKLAGRYTVRLVSTYSRQWKTERASFPHRLPPEALDFCEPVVSVHGEKRIWSRPWNFVPGGDFTGFVAGRPGLPIHDDPLCEVGCTFAVRGFDFDYIGLLWLDDLQWVDGRWIVRLDNVHESGISALVRQARREGLIAPAGPNGANLLEKVRQAYRIVLTRAIRGVYVWIPDAATRDHVNRSLATSLRTNGSG